MGELHTRLSGPVIATDDDAVGLAHLDATPLDWRVVPRRPRVSTGSRRGGSTAARAGWSRAPRGDAVGVRAPEPAGRRAMPTDRAESA
jgi:hypothetical protein